MTEHEDKWEHEWKRTKRHHSALTIALKLGLEKTVMTMSECVVFTQNRSCGAADAAYSYTFLRGVVCLSVVCLSYSCLDCSMDLDAVWQVDLWGSMTCCVWWGPWPAAEGEVWGVIPQPKHAIANCSLTVIPVLPPGEYKPGVAWPCHSVPAFCQIFFGPCLL